MDETVGGGDGEARRARRARPAWPRAARRRPAPPDEVDGASAAEGLALLRERLHIARDLHDLLAEQVVEGNDIADHLRQLRAVLADEPDDGEDGSVRPPSLADLDAIVGPFAAEGLDVHASARVPDGLAAVLDLHAGRIVQEALANVLRHSAARSARVFVATEAGRLVVEVTDPGPSRDQVQAVDRPASTDAGRGLVGIRERVRLVGGAVEVGPVGAGFRVRAVLPL